MKHIYVLMAIILGWATSGWSQTMIPLPVHSSVYSGSVRGYWFVAPTNFTIVGLRVSPDAGSGDQYIHLMKINDPTPVVYSASSSNFTTLAYISAATNGVIQPVNINVTNGDIIGVLGHVGTGTANSYSASATPFAATIGAFNISLNRLLYQGSLTGGPAPNYSTEGNGTPISRVEIYYQIGPPCPVPTALNASAITSKTATVSWTAVAGSVGYEYAVTTSATPPMTGLTTTTLTSVNLTALTPSTTYYLHVRNKCTGNGISQWVTYSFMTLPPCQPPIGFKVSNLSPTSGTINWNVWASALSYDYLIDLSRNDPTSTTGITNTLTTSANSGVLLENTWYYVHIRSKCAAGEISNWSLDSFLTPIPCRAPIVKIDHINTDEAVAYWDPVPTALNYEYAVTTSPTPPILGTKYLYTTLHTAALNDGKDYYVHVRSQCNSLGVAGTSDWGTASFKTFPVSVGTAGNKDFNVALSPNPARTQVTVTVNGSMGNNSLEITDISGKVLIEMKNVSNAVVVNTSSLAPGVYLLKYKDSIHSQVSQLVKE
ncbi:fibronectin type III domain-containing protein [Polluticoccus soli]|uniref:fibronectin type III domain-containing protein n=1 Tax=Polluticoccus soli TaxID=3034150 RepID=UPI0023E2C213|nr:T9SS type A sorting domain-containing protein [Flavipsychrobacter sp. JY13-12]